MGYTVHGILQARILERGAFPFSRGSSQPRDQTRVSCIVGRFFTNWAFRETQGRQKPMNEESPWGSKRVHGSLVTRGWSCSGRWPDPVKPSPIICLQSSSSLQKVGLRHSDQLWSYGLSMAKKRAWHHRTPESLWLRLGEGVDRCLVRGRQKARQKNVRLQSGGDRNIFFDFPFLALISVFY